MKPSKFFLALALGLSAALAAAAQTTQINGAGATFPYPIYSKWFSEYNKLHPDVEINYQSIGSGGGIRQLTSQTVFFGASDGPMTRRAAEGGARAVLHFPTVLGAVVPIYNIPGVDAAAEVHRRGPRRHLPRQDHQVERPRDRGAQPGRQAAGDRHHRRAPLRRLRHHVHLHRLPLARSRPSGKQKVGVGDLGELAGRPRRQGQRGRRRPRQADAGRDRLRRADLRDPEQDRVRLGAERRAASSCRRRWRRSPRRPRARRKRCRPTSGSRSPTRPARAPIRSRPSPGCCLREAEGQGRAAKIMVDFMKWALDRRTEVLRGPRLRAAAREVVGSRWRRSEDHDLALE